MYKTIALFLFLSVLSHTVLGQATHVQTATLFQVGASVNIIVPFTLKGSTTGNLIVVHLTYSGVARNVVSVTDSRGNTYAKSNGPTNWNGVACWRSELWYAYNITGGAFPITVAATLSGAPQNVCGLQFFQMYMSEFTGVVSASNPLDQTSSAQANSTNPNSGSKVVGFANELIYGAAVGGTLGAITQGAGFTSLSSANGNRIEFKNAGPGAQAAAFVAAPAGTWVADMATFKTTGIVLPIKLTIFQASVNEAGNVNVNWSTETEINSDYFELQRSRDGFNWTVLKKLSGSGNSYITKDYEFTDIHPYNGLNYYRLNQVDFDGKHDLSEIIKVEKAFSESSSVSVYPNPVENWLALVGTEEELSAVMVFDVYGQPLNSRIIEIKTTDTGLSLDLSHFESGIYLIKTKTTISRIVKK